MDDETERRLRELLDKQDIHEVLLRQARAFDRRDEELFKTVYHPGAVRRTPTGYLPQPDAQLATIRSYDDGKSPSAHIIGNHLIEVEGDVAFSEAYFLIVWQSAEDDKTLTHMRGGRYLDRFERRDGVWRIAFRVITDDWTQTEEVLTTLDVSAHAFAARASRSDPLYVELREGVVGPASP
jgi:hypothetical protein